MLFEPKLEDLNDQGYKLCTVLVTIQQDGSMTISLHNFQGVPVKLPAGLGLGLVRSVDLGDVIDDGVQNCDGGAVEMAGCEAIWSGTYLEWGELEASIVMELGIEDVTLV